MSCVLLVSRKRVGGEYVTSFADHFISPPVLFAHCCTDKMRDKRFKKLVDLLKKSERKDEGTRETSYTYDVAG